MKTLFLLFAFFYFINYNLNGQINQGLVCFYPFNGNSFDESGNGNNLTNYGSSLTQDRFGNSNKAFSFTSGQYMEIASANNLPIGNSSRSISCWMKTGITNSTMVLTEWGTHSPSNRFSLMTYSVNSCEFFSAFANDVQGSIFVADNQWKHLVVIYENGNLKLYVNRILDKNESIQSLNTINNLLRLGSSNINTEFFDGELDDIRIYNRALSENEVNQLYHENNWNTGPVAFYPFNGNATDESGKGNHGANNGAVLTTDRFGNPNKAYQFNGNNNWIDILYSNSLEFATGDFSVFAWIQTVSDNFQRIVSKGECFNTGWQLGSRSKIEPSFQSPPNGPFYPQSLNSNYNNGEWRFIGFTRKNGYIQIWGDALHDGDSVLFPYTMSNPSELIKIGRCRESNGNCNDAFFNGKIDDIRIYERALDDTEINNLYHEDGYLSTAFLKITCLLEGFYYPFLHVQRDDSAKVYLRQISIPYTIVDSSKIFLEQNGNAFAKFQNLTNSSYYIILNHRNTVETWSKSGGEIFIIGDTTNFDFTISASQAYGNNLKHKGTKWVVFSGDVNKDGLVDVADLSNIDNDARNFIYGYVDTDLSGDDFVDISDLTIGDNNAFNYIGLIRP